MSEVLAARLLAKSGTKRLRLQVSRRVDGILHGERLGVLPGSGAEPAEGRKYVPGDDVRRMDWAVMARTNEAYVRTTVAERELSTMLVVDVSPSMLVSSQGVGKRMLALTMTAAFLELGNGPGDRIGMVLATRNGVARIPSRPAKPALDYLLSQVDEAQEREAAAAADERAVRSASLGEALGAVNLTQRGVTVVISDFLDGDGKGEPEWRRVLTRVASRHDTICVCVSDALERELPELGVINVVDPETHERFEVSTKDPELRARYREAALASFQAREQVVRGCGADWLSVSTEDDWLKSLTSFLQQRRQRRTMRGSGR